MSCLLPSLPLSPLPFPLLLIMFLRDDVNGKLPALSPPPPPAHLPLLDYTLANKLMEVQRNKMEMERNQERSQVEAERKQERSQVEVERSQMKVERNEMARLQEEQQDQR